MVSGFDHVTCINQWHMDQMAGQVQDRVTRDLTCFPCLLVPQPLPKENTQWLSTEQSVSLKTSSEKRRPAEPQTASNNKWLLL